MSGMSFCDVLPRFQRVSPDAIAKKRLVYFS